MGEKFAAVVLSGGVGSRMQSSIPKQYLPLLGKEVLYYSLKAFQDSPVEEIALVVGQGYQEYCRKEIVEKYGFTKVKHIVLGGKERYHSVAAGLEALGEDIDFVLIQDGARPMLDAKIISDSIEMVKQTGACVTAVPVKDTIKRVDEQNYALETPDRKSLWQIQTPQTFPYSMITKAYRDLLELERAGKLEKNITDDAMVVEEMTGQKVKMVMGSYENLKITTPEDLKIAELFLGQR